MDNSDSVKKEEMSSTEDNPLLKQNDFNSSEHVEPTVATQEGATDKITVQTDAKNSDVNESLYRLDKTNEFPLKQDRSADIDDESINFTLHLSLSDTMNSKDVSDVQTPCNTGKEPKCAEPSLNESAIAPNKIENHPNQEQEIELNVSSSKYKSTELFSPAKTEQSSICTSDDEKLEIDESALEQVTGLNLSTSKPQATEIPTTANNEQSFSTNDKEKLEIDESALEEATGLNLSTSKPQATEIPTTVNNEQSFSTNDEKKLEIDESALDQATGLNLSTSKPQATEIPTTVNNAQSFSTNDEEKLEIDESALEEATGLNLSTSKPQATEIPTTVNNEQSFSTNDEKKLEIDESALDQATGLNLSTSKPQATEIPTTANNEQSFSTNDEEKLEIDESALEEATGLNLSTSKPQATEIPTTVNNEQSFSSNDEEKLEIDESALDEATGLNLSTHKCQGTEISPPVNTERSSICSSDDEGKSETDESALEEATGLNLSTSKCQTTEISPPVNTEQSLICSSDDEEKLEIDESALEEETGLNLSTTNCQAIESSPPVKIERSSICSSDDEGKSETDESALEEATGLNLSAPMMLKSPLESSTFEKSINHSSVDMNSSLMNMDVSMLNISGKKPEENQNLEAVTEGTNIPTMLLKSPLENSTLKKRKSINYSSVDMNSSLMNMDVSLLNMSRKQPEGKPNLEEVTEIQECRELLSTNITKPELSSNGSFPDEAKQGVDDLTSEQTTGLNLSSSKLHKSYLESSTLEKSLNYSSVDINSSLMNMDVSLLNMSRKKPEEKPSLEVTEVSDNSTKLQECTELTSDIAMSKKSSKRSSLDKSEQDVNDSALEQATELNLSISKFSVSPLKNSSLEKSLNYSSIDMNSSLMNMDVSLMNISRKKPDEKPNFEEITKHTSSNKLQEYTELSSPDFTIPEQSSDRRSPDVKQDVDDSILERGTELNSSLSTDMNASLMGMDVSLLNMSRKKLNESLCNTTSEQSSKHCPEDQVKQNSQIQDLSSINLQTELNLSPPKLNKSIEKFLGVSTSNSNPNGPSNQDDEDKFTAEQTAEVNISLKDGDKSFLEQITEENLSSPIDVPATQHLVSTSSDEPNPDIVKEISSIDKTTESNVSLKLNPSIEPSLDKSASEQCLSCSLNEQLKQDEEIFINKKETESNVSLKLNVSNEQCLDKSCEQSSNSSNGQMKQELKVEKSSIVEKTEQNASSTKLNVSIDKSATEEPLNHNLLDEFNQHDKGTSFLEQDGEVLLDQSTNITTTDQRLKQDDEEVLRAKEKTDVSGSPSKFEKDEEKSELNLSATQLNDSGDSSSIEILPLNQLLEGIESIYDQGRDVTNVSVSEHELIRSSTPLELSPKIDCLLERPRTCCSTIDEELESLVQDLSEHYESGNDILNLRCPTPANKLRDRLKRAEDIAQRLRHDLLELSEFTTYEAQCIKSEKMASSEIGQENEILKKKLAEAESTIEKNVELVAEISSKIESLTLSNESLTSQNKKLSSECEILKIKLTDEEVRVELSDNRWKKMVEELQKSLDEAWRINNRPKLEDIELKKFNDNHPILPSNVTVSDISLCLSVSESPVRTQRLNNMSMENYENPNYTVKFENNPDNFLEDPLKSTISSDESDHDSTFGTPLASQNGDNQKIDDFLDINEGERRLKYEEIDYFKVQTFLEAITGKKYLNENVFSELDAMLDFFTDKIMEAKKIMGGSGTHDFFTEMIEIVHNYQLLQPAYDKLDQTKSGLEYFESIFKGVDDLQDLNDRLKRFNEEQNVSETLKEGITKITRSLQNKNEEFSVIENSLKSLGSELEDSKFEYNVIKEAIKRLALSEQCFENCADMIKSIERTREEYDKYNKAFKSIKETVSEFANYNQNEETDIGLIVQLIIKKVQGYDKTFSSLKLELENSKSENSLIKNFVKDLASTYNINEEDVDTIIQSIKSEKEKFDATYNAIISENSLIKKSINQLAISHEIDETDVVLVIDSVANRMENYKSKTLNSEHEIDSLKTENCSIKNLVKNLGSAYNINEEDVDAIIKSIKSEKEKFDAAHNSINTENNLIKKSINQLAINLDIDETDIPLIIESIANKIKSYNSEFKTLKSELDSLKSENCLIKNSVKEHYQVNEDDVDSLTRHIKVMKEKYDSLNLENSSLKESIYQFAKLHHIEYRTDVNFVIKSIMDKVNGNFESIKSELDELKTEYCMITKSVKELGSDLNIDEDNIDFLIKSIKKNNEEFRTTSQNLKSELDQLKLENSLIEKSICKLAEYHHIKERDVNAIIKSAIEKVEGYDRTFESLKLELDGVKSKKDSINESVKELALIYHIDEVDDINSIIESIKRVVEEQDRKTKNILELINEIPQKPSDTWDIISNKIQSLQQHISSLSSNDNYNKIQELENELQDAYDLKRSFAKELNSLDPTLRVYDLMELPLKDLKVKLFSTFMEKEQVMFEKLQLTHDENINVYTDKIKQLEEEQKRTAVWSKELEEENEKINNECKLIKIKMSQLESEIQDKCESNEKKEEDFKEEIRKLNNSLDETDNKSIDVVVCEQCDTLKQLCNDLSSQLNEKIDCCHQHEKTIEDTNKKLEMINLDLRSKAFEIETSEHTLKSLKEKYFQLHQENKKLTDNNQLLESDLKKTQCEKDNTILKLKDQINVLMSQVETLQIKGVEDFSAELASSKAKLLDYETQFNHMKVKYEDDFAKLNQVIAQKDKEIEEILSKLKQAKNKLTNINVWEKKYKDLEIESKESQTRFECLSKNLNDDLKCKSLRIAELDAALKSASNSYQSSLSDKTNECERLSKKLEESKLTCARLENKLISQKDIYFKEKQELSFNLERLLPIFNKIQTLIDCVSWDDALVKLKVKISLCEELTKQLEEEKENNKQLDDESEILYTNIKQLEEELSHFKIELYECRLSEKSNKEKYDSLEKEYLELKNYQKKSEEYFDKIKKLVNKNTFEEALSDIISNITLCKDLQNELDEKIQNIKDLDSENEVLYQNSNDLEKELNEAKIQLYEKEKKLDTKTEDILNKLISIQGQNFSLEKELLNKSNEFETYKQKMEVICDKIKQIGQKETIEEALLRIKSIINTSSQLQTQLEKQTQIYDSVIKESGEMKLEMAKTKKEALKYEAMSRRNDEKLKGYISAQEHNTIKIKKLEEEIDIQQKKFDANIDQLSLELKQLQDKLAQEKIKATKLEEELNMKRNEDFDTAQNTKKPLKESQQNEVPCERSREDGITDALKNESIANLKIQLSKNKAALQSKNELIQSYKTKVLELEKKNQTYKTKLEYCGTEEVRPPVNNFQSDLISKIQELTQTNESLKNDIEVVKKLANVRWKKLKDYEAYMTKIGMFPPKQECENVSGSSTSNDRN